MTSVSQELSTDERATIEAFAARDGIDAASELGFRVAGYALLAAVAAVLLTGNDDVPFLDVAITALGFGLLTGAGSLLKKQALVSVLTVVAVAATVAIVIWG